MVLASLEVSKTIRLQSRNSPGDIRFYRVVPASTGLRKPSSRLALADAKSMRGIVKGLSTRTEQNIGLPLGG